MSEAEKTVVDTSEKKSAPEAKKNIFADFDYSNHEISMESMLAAGVHFGHPKSRCHPKMRDFTFSTRNNISIIDLSQSVSLLETALSFLEQVNASGKKILFVGTKKQTHRFVQAIAEETDNPYVIERWLGGTLTNFGNIRRRVKYMMTLRDQFEKNELSRYTKLERLKKQEELDKLLRRMGGIETMTEMPGAIFVTDIKSDALAIKEAQALGIPVVGIADTNVNPEHVDYPIPGNDDALSSLKYLIGHVAKVLKK